jgi:hypothetical protein
MCGAPSPLAAALHSVAEINLGKRLSAVVADDKQAVCSWTVQGGGKARARNDSRFVISVTDQIRHLMPAFMGWPSNRLCKRVFGEE